jgi:ribosomal protein S20
MRHTAEEMRQHAKKCKAMIEGTDKEAVKARLQRLAEGWEQMAEAQEWLDRKQPNQHAHG